jgi:hypothetical protein
MQKRLTLPITHSEKQALYGEKLQRLRAADGYKSVMVDSEGRLVVVVDDTNIDSDEASLYRRVWGSEWPTVRSEPWRDGKAVDEQLLFTSRG